MHNKEDFRKSLALETKKNRTGTTSRAKAKPPSEFRWKMGQNKPPLNSF